MCYQPNFLTPLFFSDLINNEKLSNDFGHFYSISSTYRRERERKSQFPTSSTKFFYFLFQELWIITCLLRVWLKNRLYFTERSATYHFAIFTIVSNSPKAGNLEKVVIQEDIFNFFKPDFNRYIRCRTQVLIPSCVIFAYLKLDKKCFQKNVSLG